MLAHTVSRNVRSQIKEVGYSAVQGDDFALTGTVQNDLAELRACWNNLEADPYYGTTHPDTYRVRRYSDFTFVPGCGLVTRQSNHPYYQSLRQNAYVGGIVRSFGEVLPETYNNPLFKELVRMDFDYFSVDKEYLNCDWICQVHMIRIVVGSGLTTPVTPEGIHSDGYPFAAVHFMGREDVSGGESSVFTGEGVLLATLTFEQPLDTLWLEDRKMKHYVTPISGTGVAPGHRDILAISFSLPGSPYETDV